MFKKNIFCGFILVLLNTIVCYSQQKVTPIKSAKKKKLTEIELKNWHCKDPLQDTISGISLERAYKEIIKNKTKLNEIIVAVIDTQIDLYHEDLKEQIWTNKKEIPNNNIDDDRNGYIDDVNGWSFIGTKSGGYVVWANFEYVRFVREWNPYFKDKIESQIPANDLVNYKEYQRALKHLSENEKYYKNWQKSLKHNIAVYPLVKDTLKYFFPKENYTYQQLDSLYKVYKINDKTYKQRRDSNDRDLGALISYMMVNIDVNQKNIEDIQDASTQLDSIITKNIDINYDDRKLIGDNPKILEKGYGNNKVCSTIEGLRSLKEHGTRVSGIIAANRQNRIGIKGFSDKIKIMPLHISLFGDQHDKDIVMAIKYAVDNGAKVINLSIGKEFSLHKKWVHDAFKYAESHNVLLIHASGNDGFNVDYNPFYPSDIAYDGTGEISNNFINVGSTTQKADSTLVSNFSNYGKNNLDIFAPGEEIYTTNEENKYAYDSGTSLAAPMVSGTAALIWLYYPKLTAAQVKQIIMDPGVAYDIEVIVPGTTDKKVKFSELSKSGKVVNVYNALLMAKKMSNE
jgi:cell wall-associated protease